MVDPCCRMNFNWSLIITSDILHWWVPCCVVLELVYLLINQLVILANDIWGELICWTIFTFSYVYKLEGVAPLIADPPRYNSIFVQQPHDSTCDARFSWTPVTKSMILNWHSPIDGWFLKSYLHFSSRLGMRPSVEGLQRHGKEVCRQEAGRGRARGRQGAGWRQAGGRQKGSMRQEGA